MKTYLVMGASRGLGASVTEYLHANGNHVFALSRSPAVAGDWVEADVSTDEGIDKVVEAIGGRTLDGLLYMGGTWEKGAFTDEYEFLKSPRAETRNVIEVNLVAPILLVQALAANLRRAENPRVLLMGSMSGLPNTATMFGLQGVAEAINLALRGSGIGVSVIKPDNMATPEVERDIEQGLVDEQTPVALSELSRTVDYLLNAGATALPTVVNLTQLKK
ncbi:MAG: SDR family NAD(P)-dependent oxidoreductase [Planctomycetota bacterium]